MKKEKNTVKFKRIKILKIINTKPLVGKVLTSISNFFRNYVENSKESKK
jgi:hypothetical protein